MSPDNKHAVRCFTHYLNRVLDPRQTKELFGRVKVLQVNRDFNHHKKVVILEIDDKPSTGHNGLPRVFCDQLWLSGMRTFSRATSWQGKHCCYPSKICSVVAESRQ